MKKMKFRIEGLLVSLTLCTLVSNGSAHVVQCTCYYVGRCTLIYGNNSILKDAAMFCPANMKNIEYLFILHFTDKILQSDTFNAYANLSSMELSEGSIRLIKPGAFEKLSNLTKLSIEERKLTSLEDYTFRGLIALEILDMQCNNLTYIAPHAFDGLKSLEHLSLSGNKLTQLPAKLISSSPKLKWLSLSNNLLTHLPDGIFDNIDYLFMLDLSHNQLDTFRFPNLTVVRLSLHNNLLTRLHINDHVKFVQAHHNQIRSMMGTGRNVTELWLHDNAISDVTSISRMANLTKLILNNNPLQPHSVFASLPLLEELLLKNTSIQIRRNTFANLSSMVLLDLSYNNLKEVDFQMFSSMIDLETLVVAHNRIQMINFIELRKYLPDLRILEICDNGWNATYTEHVHLEMQRHRLWRLWQRVPKTLLFRTFFTELCLVMSDTSYEEDSDYSFENDINAREQVSAEIYPTSSPSPIPEGSVTDQFIDASTTTSTNTPPRKHNVAEPTAAVSLNIIKTMSSMDHVPSDHHQNAMGSSPFYVAFQVLVHTLGIMCLVVLGYYVRLRHLDEEVFKKEENV